MDDGAQRELELGYNYIDGAGWLTWRELRALTDEDDDEDDAPAQLAPGVSSDPRWTPRARYAGAGLGVGVCWPERGRERGRHQVPGEYDYPARRSTAVAPAGFAGVSYVLAAIAVGLVTRETLERLFVLPADRVPERLPRRAPRFAPMSSLDSCPDCSGLKTKTAKRCQECAGVARRIASLERHKQRNPDHERALASYGRAFRAYRRSERRPPSG